MPRIELIDNLIQLAVTLLCCVGSGCLYLSRRKQEYFLLCCFYGCFSLGLLYWTLFLLLFRETPKFFYVSETVWISSFIFLQLVQYTFAREDERAFRCKALHLVPLVNLILLVQYCVMDDVFSSLLCCSAMTIISWYSLRGLCFWRGRRETGARQRRLFHGCVLFYVAMEYCLWTSSLFWQGDSLANPYFWFDFALTATLLALLPIAERAVGK